MANPVTVDDLADRWRPLSSQEQTNAQALLDDAWALLTTRLPSLEDNLTAETVSTANLVRVECAMVLRVMRNPDGLLQESIDDYSYQRDAAVSAGALYVTTAELGDLTPGGKVRRSTRLVAYTGDGWGE